jgi:hypothetical protein
MFISQCRELDARHRKAIFLASSNSQETISPTVIEQQAAPAACSPAPTNDVSGQAALKSLLLDETIGYFAVQADHARANEVLVARLRERRDA